MTVPHIRLDRRQFYLFEGLGINSLEGIEVSNHTAEAIADWHYWCARGYCF